LGIEPVLLCATEPFGLACLDELTRVTGTASAHGAGAAFLDAAPVSYAKKRPLSAAASSYLQERLFGCREGVQGHGELPVVRGFDLYQALPYSACRVVTRHTETAVRPSRASFITTLFGSLAGKRRCAEASV